MKVEKWNLQRTVAEPLESPAPPQRCRMGHFRPRENYEGSGSPAIRPRAMLSPTVK